MDFNCSFVNVLCSNNVQSFTFVLLSVWNVISGLKYFFCYSPAVGDNECVDWFKMERSGSPVGGRDDPRAILGNFYFDSYNCIPLFLPLYNVREHVL